jgi:replication factor C subunit 2/4
VLAGKSIEALEAVMGLLGEGYAATDVIQTLFKVTKSLALPEEIKLNFLREIGFSHMRIADGLNTQLQIAGCVARLANVSSSHDDAGLK